MFWFGFGKRPEKGDSSEEEEEDDDLHRSTTRSNPKEFIEGQSNNSKPLTIHLVLIHLADLVTQDSNEGIYLDQVLTRVFDHKTASVLSAEEWLQQSTSGTIHNKKFNSPKLAQELSANIRRYVRLSDRYIAWASLLVKRLVFYRAHASILRDSISEQIPPPDFPLVDLPRTEYKKPFIPSPSSSSSRFRKTKREDRYSDTFNYHHRDIEWFPFSISHQFPWIGVAHIETLSGSSTITTTRQNPPFCLGIDIVHMESPNPRLFQNDEEFVEIMGSLTPQERRRLWSYPKQNKFLLYEFYLVWSMKEAYTKALGVGMGLAFDSFGIHLSDVSKDSCVWEMLVNHHHHNENKAPQHGDNKAPKTVTMTSQGEIQFVDGRPSEKWLFSFVVLSAAKADTVRSPNEAPECACICWNPTASDGNSIHIQQLPFADILPMSATQQI